MQNLEKVAVERKSDGGKPRAEGGLRALNRHYRIFSPRTMGHTVPTRAVVLRTVLQKGRNVALKRANPRKGRFKEEIGRREAQGGRGVEL